MASTTRARPLRAPAARSTPTGGVRAAVRWALFGLCLFAGVTATAGGIELVAFRHGGAWLPIELLVDAPFDTFLVPGLLLGGVVGLANVVAAVLVAMNDRFAAGFAFVAGAAMTIFISVEFAMLRDRSFLEWLYLGVGVATCLLAILAAPRRRPARG